MQHEARALNFTLKSQVRRRSSFPLTTTIIGMSDFSVSTDNIDLLDFASSQSQSPTSMALPSPINPPSAISGPGEKETASSTILTTHEDNEYDVENVMLEHPVVNSNVGIDSFLPLLQALDSPGLQLINGEYHLRGFISKGGFKKLSDYARRVTKFTLNDAHPLVEPGTLLRLVQLSARYNKSDTFFLSLKSLSIDRASKPGEISLSLLPLFLVPTLEVLEVEHIPHLQFDTFLTFLATLADEAPYLSSITLGASSLYYALHSTCMRFVNLRELKLNNMGSILRWSTLHDIGQLPELETLILDAKAVQYLPNLSPSHLDHTGMPKDEYIHPDDAHPTQAHLFGWGNGTIGTLSSRVPSPSPSIPDIDELHNLELPTEVVEQEKPSAHSPEVGFYKLKTLHVVAEEGLISELINLIASSEIFDISLTLISCPAPPEPKPPKPEKRAKPASKSAFTPATLNPDPELVTKRFQDILKKILASWAHSLTAVRICYEKGPPVLDDSYPELELSIFRSLLSQSLLRHLEITGWTMSSNFGDALHHLSTLAQPSSLETLHLPIDLGTKGISFSRLRGIFESCPSLTSFQCGFKHLSNVPALPEGGVVFGLRKLGVGNPMAHDDRQRLIAVAQYLDALFPKLETIKTWEGCNAQQWQEILELVQMCQLSRSYHRQHVEKA